MKDKDGYEIHELEEIGIRLLNTDWMHQKPISKIIDKIPMSQLVITKDGGVWLYWFDHGVRWRFKYWIYPEKK